MGLSELARRPIGGLSRAGARVQSSRELMVNRGAATGFPSFAGTKQMIWCGLLRSWPAFFKSSDAPSSGQPSRKNSSIRSFTRPIPALDSAALILPFSLDMSLPLLANSFFDSNQASVQLLGFMACLSLAAYSATFGTCAAVLKGIEGKV